MSLDTVFLTLAIPGGEHAFAPVAQEAIAGAVRALPPGIDAPPVTEPVPGHALAWPHPAPPDAAIPHDGLPARRRAAIFAAPFDETAPCWLTHAVFPERSRPPGVVSLASLRLHVDRGVATLTIAFGLNGFPLADVTVAVESGEGVLVPSPGRAERTGDWARITDSLFALTAALPDRPDRRWTVDLTSRVEPLDSRRLIDLVNRLNAAR